MTGRRVTEVRMRPYPPLPAYEIAVGLPGGRVGHALVFVRCTEGRAEVTWGELRAAVREAAARAEMTDAAKLERMLGRVVRDVAETSTEAVLRYLLRVGGASAGDIGATLRNLGLWRSGGRAGVAVQGGGDYPAQVFGLPLIEYPRAPRGEILWFATSSACAGEHILIRSGAEMMARNLAEAYRPEGLHEH